jgi:hypothetical protein
MKWGYVRYHFLFWYNDYCILYNKKTDEKPKKKPDRTVATLETDEGTALLSQSPHLFITYIYAIHNLTSIWNIYIYLRLLLKVKLNFSIWCKGQPVYKKHSAANRDIDME